MLTWSMLKHRLKSGETRDMYRAWLQRMRFSEGRVRDIIATWGDEKTWGLLESVFADMYGISQTVGGAGEDFVKLGIYGKNFPASEISDLFQIRKFFTELSTIVDRQQVASDATALAAKLVRCQLLDLALPTLDARLQGKYEEADPSPILEAIEARLLAIESKPAVTAADRNEKLAARIARIWGEQPANMGKLVELTGESQDAITKAVQIIGRANSRGRI